MKSPKSMCMYVYDCVWHVEEYALIYAEEREGREGEKGKKRGEEEREGERTCRGRHPVFSIPLHLVLGDQVSH